MLLVKNIKGLAQIRDNKTPFVAGETMSELPTIQNAYLWIENGLIKDFGEMHKLPEIDSTSTEIIDASGQFVLPTWCDSHTHLVFADTREGEFEDRIKGLTYQEIAAKGGGILNSAKKLQETSEDDLFASAYQRLKGLIKLGTGAIEIKSGYGLTVDAELKMLHVIKRLKETSPIPIKATFLGAHAIPAEFKENREGYINSIINEMLPKIAIENLADYIDVFCETNYFTVEEMSRILEAGAKYGLTPKVHVNQFTAIGGIKASLKYSARSVDHLEIMGSEDFDALKNSKCMPTALPSCSFFLGIPYAPTKEMINKGLPIALASDYNPGSTPSGNMNFVVALACIKMKLTPQQAINAATLNSAYAMNLENEVGSITKGKKANFMITEKANSLAYLPYSFGQSRIDKVYINGQLVK